MKGAPGEHLLARESHDALDLALGLGPVGPAQLDGEVVVRRERDRLGIKLDVAVATPPDVVLDDRLGAVVEDRRRHAAEVIEGAPVAVPEGGEVLGGEVATERVARVGKHHVEAVDGKLSGGRDDRSFVAPVDLGLGAGDGLEAPVHRRARLDPELGLDLRPPDADVFLDPLVAARELVGAATRRSWMVLALILISSRSH